MLTAVTPEVPDERPTMVEALAYVGDLGFVVIEPESVGGALTIRCGCRCSCEATLTVSSRPWHPVFTAAEIIHWAALHMATRCASCGGAASPALT